MLQRRRIVLAALAATCTLAIAQPAFAHVDPDVTEVPAGGSVTVAFTIEHGCDGSPTTKLEFKVPLGVTGVVPVAKEGWKGEVANGIVTFTGGPLPDDEESAFSIGFTAPTTVGQTIRFPLIQTCEQGQLDWIQLSEEDDRPAPAMTVGKADPTATTTTAPGATTTTTEAAPTTTEAGGTTTTITTGLAPDTAKDDEDSASSDAPVIIGGVVVVTIAGVLAAVLVRRRRKVS